MSLKEIARIAGTSVSTVSRVLNQPDYKCKNPELESRIWAAAQEIRYTPNTAAQTLKSGISLARTEEKTMTFDIFLTRFPSLSQDLFFSELFEFLKKELLRQQCVIGKFLTLPEVTSMLNEKSSFSATDKHADGIILLGKCPSELISPLQNHYHNIVGIDRNPTDFAYDEVICNGTNAAITAMNYLISLGHKKIAYIGDCSYEARYIGYYQSLISHSLPLDYSNDSTALGVFDCLRHRRKKGYVPSIISIDNIRESEQTKPMLTTIDIPKEEMAHHAVKLLLDRIHNGHNSAARIELPCKLLVRESCSISPH